jgi:hypothetical protein
MRETCARALAAALLAAAIATVVGMSAFYGTPSDPGRPMSAPSSTLQRTVRLTAHLAPRHRRRTPALVTTHSNRSTAARREAVMRSMAVVRRRHRPARRPAQRQLAETPTPVPAAAPAPPVPPSPAPEPPPPDQAGGHVKGNGHGHAYGHEKQDE